MKTFSMITLTGILALGLACPVLAGLDEHLQVLDPYIGKTFEGQFTDAASGRTMIDVQKWESTLGGKAVRTVHSLNEGEYGGETIIFWDPAAEALTFYYFTTAGFFTHGTLTAGDGEFTAHETVEGQTGGISEVRSTSRLLEDGRIQMTSEFLKDGAWVPGHEILYVENPEAKVVFE